METRRATAEDRDFLVDMLVEAYNWTGEARVTHRDVEADPQVGKYVDGWPRQGDVGVIAVEGGAPIGAAWARPLPADDAGYGFVAEDVPEITMAVAPAARGRGVGRSLLLALIDEARAAGFRAVSLSVEDGNPAVALYRSAGFEAVGRSGSSDTMLLRLR